MKISIPDLRLYFTVAAAAALACALAIPSVASGEEPPADDAGRYATGFVRPSVRIPHVERKVPLQKAAQLPARFDWREHGKVTGVKNQSACGSCYAFGAIASIEAMLLVQGEPEYDFSENNVKECEWYESSCYGGNFFRVSSFLSQYGTVRETCDPYVAAPVACKTTCPYVITLLGWNLISGDSIPDPELIKSYLYTYGPLYITFYAGSGDSWGGEFRNYDGSYTLYHETSDEPNHAVLLVGWDDDLVHAGGQGAWIVKNSWGDFWGGTCGYGSQRGFFTMGYGSARMGWYTSYMSEWKDYDPDGRLLYYDEGGYSEDSEGFGSNTGWGLCKFYPADDMRVERIEFWTTDATTDVDVYLYDDFDGSAAANLLASRLDLSFAELGYHSVELPEPVVIEAGDDICAVVKFTNASFDAPIPLDDQGPAESSRCFVSTDGATWQDIRTLPGHANSDVGIRLRGTEVENSHTWRVPGDAETLAGAAYLADAGDTLLVAPGTYPVTALEIDETLVILSEAGPGSTFIDGSGPALTAPTEDVLTFRDVGSSTVLKGFAFTGIQGAVGVSAISVINASPRIEDCVIAGMSSSAGTAINIAGGAPCIRNCTLHSNSVYSAICFGPSTAARVENCIISYTSGGAALSCVMGTEPLISCSNLYWNFGGDEICGNDGGGNFSGDPLYCDAESGDFSLQDASPCLAREGCGRIGAFGQGCPTYVPEALDAFAATAGDAANSLTWTLPAPPVQGAYIRYSSTGYPGSPEDGEPVENGNGGYFAGDPSAGNSYMHGGLVNGTPYYYTAFAYNGGLLSGTWLNATATPEDAGPPGAPSNVDAEPASGQVTLAWTYPGDADLEGVAVRYSTVSYPAAYGDGSPVENGTGGVFTGEPGAGASFVHTGLTDEITYYYSLFAFDEVPYYSLPAEVSASPGDDVPPGAVTHFSVAPSDSALTLSWTCPSDPDFEGILIRYSQAASPPGPTDGSPVPNGASGIIYCEAAAQDSFTHEGLENGETYYYSAFAFDGRLNYSTGVSASGAPVDLVAPGTPGGFTATAGDTTITLRWTNPGDVDFDHTLIRYSTASCPATPLEGEAIENGAGGKFHGARAGVDSFVHSGLDNDIAFYYAAFAADEVPNHSAAVQVSAVPEDTLSPAGVTAFGAKAGDASVTLKWTAPATEDVAGVAIRYSTSDYPGAADAGMPVENGSGGLFPAGADSFAHAWLTNETRYYYSVFAYDEVPNYSTRDTVSIIPYDQTPPILSISVFQNPYITNHVDVFVIASEAMNDTSMRCSVGDAAIGLEMSDEEEHVCRGDFDLCSTGNLSIDVSGRDLRGNWSSGTREFSSSTVLTSSGGKVTSPDGKLTAELPGGWLDRDAHVLVFESAPGATLDPACGAGATVYRLSPGSLQINGVFEISIEYGEHVTDPEFLALARIEDGRLIPLDSYLRRDRARVTAFVNTLGSYVLARRTDAVTPDYGSGSLRVFQNAPNPFAGTTGIAFELPRPGRVRADIITVEGRLVRNLADAVFTPGRHSLEWNGRDSAGKPAGSGLYLYRVKTGSEAVTRKMILLR